MLLASTPSDEYKFTVQKVTQVQHFQAHNSSMIKDINQLN